jgi:molybdenum cofactor synthesis domain-containing protein
MCDQQVKEQEARDNHPGTGTRVVSVNEAVGLILSHDITEIIPGEFKGRAFKKGHVVREQDIEHLRRIGKEHLYMLEIKDDEIHENDAAVAMAHALAGTGVKMEGEPIEGKVNLLAGTDGLLKVKHRALTDFNMLGEVMCATLHNNYVVKKGQVLAGTRAIPLIVKKSIVNEAVRIAENAGSILSVTPMRKPKAGLVITGNEVYHGKIKDAFEPVITAKIKKFDGDIVGVHFAPDNAKIIEDRIRELINAGADLIITTGGMSVDPDDVTRFAIRNAGVDELHYGSPVLPGAMFLVAYLQNPDNSPINKGGHMGGIPILGIPACGMYASITVFDLILPRVLAGEKIGRREIAELGHGGLCLKCDTCRYPVCPFGK